MLYKIILLWILTLGIQRIYGQGKLDYKWWNPGLNNFPIIEGQGWPHQLLHSYNRLPETAEKVVSKAVWDKSHQSAGLVIRFRTNAHSIHVWYKVNGKLSFLHMPATGVSGVDLYALSENNQWEWDCATNYSFGDTVKYNFNAIRSNTERLYYLYLPLYNSVEWLKIGVPKDAKLTPVSISDKRPIVVYGTSIAQGGVASRPGMAWPAIVGRRMNRPVINLAFSSNGLLAPNLLHLIATINAKIYILDCLPNMYDMSKSEIRYRIINAVRILQAKRPNVPILLVGHADANINMLDTVLMNEFNEVNKTSYDAFIYMKENGIKNIYYLTARQIGLNIESTVDGQHSSDYGMELYANAYTKSLKNIFKNSASYENSLSTKINVRDIKYSEWKGFKRIDFDLDTRHCTIVIPQKPLHGKLWIWRTAFFGAFAQADSMLLTKGYYIAFIDLSDTYGSTIAMNYMNKFYAYLNETRGFNSKVVLEGFSRGGLSALNWAERNPQKVSCIYLDAPVCDFKSWPGGRGMFTYSKNDWIKLKKVYGFTSDKEAFTYQGNPIDNLSSLGGYKIPIISVCGALDTLVPISLNTYLLRYRYKKLGGKIKVVVKQNTYHHPHSLKNPTPIVSFILNNEREKKYQHENNSHTDK